jgi:hypothetical protein
MYSGQSSGAFWLAWLWLALDLWRLALDLGRLVHQLD